MISGCDDLGTDDGDPAAGRCSADVVKSGLSMKSNQGVRKIGSLRRGTGGIVLLAVTAGLAAIQQIEAAPNVVIWDMGSRFADTAGVGARSGWTSVPSELFAFEADPLKAASDPGYSGREYSFKGDAVVENHHLTALFWSAKGQVVIYSKGEAAMPLGASPESPGRSRSACTSATTRPPRRGSTSCRASWARS